MLLVLFKEIRTPEVDLFRRVFLGRLGFRALVGIVCFEGGRSGHGGSKDLRCRSPCLCSKSKHPRLMCCWHGGRIRRTFTKGEAFVDILVIVPSS